MKIKNMKQVKEHMKDMNMKRLFRRNQIIITTLAVMIAAAGYLNYAGKKDLASGNRVYEAGAMDISDEDILAENQAASLNGQAGLQEIPSLDQDPSDLDAVSDADGAQAAAFLRFAPLSIATPSKFPYNGINNQSHSCTAVRVQDGGYYEGNPGTADCRHGSQCQCGQ